MEIGTGIFSGCVFLGLVFLFIKTRDFWNWKKICISIFLLLIAISLIISGVIYITSYFNNRSIVITSLKDISLNDKLSDTLFKHDSLKPVQQFDEGNLNQEEYFDGNIWVKFENKKVASIGYACSDNIDYTTINHITCSDNSEKILNTFKNNNVRILCSNNKNAVERALNLRAYDVLELVRGMFYLQIK